MKRLCVIAFVLSATQASAQAECRTIASDAERLSCYDIANGVKTTETAPAEAFGKWQISSDFSAMTDDRSVFMMLESENAVSGRYGTPGPAVLILRCRENATSAFFTFNGLFMSDIQGHGRIEYRLDQDKMAAIDTTASNNNQALGLWNGSKSIPWIKKLLGKEKLVVRAVPHSESAVVATFDIRGIDGGLTELRDTCNW